MRDFWWKGLYSHVVTYVTGAGTGTLENMGLTFDERES